MHMPTCVSCGREISPFSTGEVSNICPECRSAAMARAQAQPPVISRRSLVLERMPVTSAIIAVNVLVFIAMTLSGVSPGMPDVSQLIKWGADFGPLTVTAQPWRILTSNYVHIGIVHILLNMWCLWNLGALVSALYHGNLPVAPSALKYTLRSLGSFAGYNLFFGAVVPGIDNSAHLGGLISGLALGAVLARHLTSPPDERNSWRRWVFIVAGAVLLLVFHFVRRSVLHGLNGQTGT